MWKAGETHSDSRPDIQEKYYLSPLFINVYDFESWLFLILVSLQKWLYIRSPFTLVVPLH